MGYLQYESIALSATTSSGASATSTGTYTGFLYAVRYIVATGATSILSTGGRITLSGDRSSWTLFLLNNLGSTADGLYFPALGTVVSTDAVVASTGSGKLPIYQERLTVTISSGSTGDPKTGTLGIYIE